MPRTTADTSTVSNANTATIRFPEAPGVALHESSGPHLQGCVDSCERKRPQQGQSSMIITDIILLPNVRGQVSPLASGIRGCSAAEMPEVPKAWGLAAPARSTYSFLFYSDQPNFTISVSSWNSDRRLLTLKCHNEINGNGRLNIYIQQRIW